MRKKIAFDLDGTILDSRFRHQKVLYDILTNKGVSEKIDNLNDFVEYKSMGRNTKQYIESKYGELVNSDEISKIWIENIEHVKYLELDKLYENTIDVLSRLNYKYDLYLVTARNNEKNILWQLDKYNITKYFKEVYVVSNQKNSALNKYNVTKELNLNIIVGDTEVDYQWSQYSKVQFLPISWGFRNNLWWKNINIKTYKNLEDIENKIYDILEG